MNLIAYTRVSTREQADSGLGLAAQAAAITAAEHAAPWTIARWASDPGVSGSKMGPELTAALNACKRGEADGIVAAKLDRISRSLFDFTRLMERSRREGWHVVTLDLGVDTTTPAGEMVANVMMAFAQYERRLIGERTRDGLRQARERGTQLGASQALPQETIDRLLAMRADGVSLRTMALELNREGVPTAKGKPWCVGSVRYVIRRYETTDK